MAGPESDHKSLALALAVWATNFAIQQMTVSTFQAAAQQQPQQPVPPIVINNIQPSAPAAYTFR